MSSKIFNNGAGAAMTAPAALKPLSQLAAKTAGSSWDGGGALALANGTELLHVHVSEDAYLVPSTSASAPAGNNGAVYAGGQTHVIPCRAMDYLHHKRAGDSDATVTATCFGY